MIADDRQPTAEPEKADGLFQGRFKILHLMINCDAKGLESTGGRVNPAAPAANSLLNYVGQFDCGLNGPPLNNSPGNLTAMDLFTILPEDPGKFCFRSG